MWEQELDVIYSNYTTYHNQKIVLFLEVLEGSNAVLAKAYSAPRPQLHFKLNLNWKNGSSKKWLGKTLQFPSPLTF